VHGRSWVRFFLTFYVNSPNQKEAGFFHVLRQNNAFTRPLKLLNAAVLVGNKIIASGKRRYLIHIFTGDKNKLNDIGGAFVMYQLLKHIHRVLLPQIRESD